MIPVSQSSLPLVSLSITSVDTALHPPAAPPLLGSLPHSAEEEHRSQEKQGHSLGGRGAKSFLPVWHDIMWVLTTVTSESRGACLTLQTPRPHPSSALPGSQDFQQPPGTPVLMHVGLCMMRAHDRDRPEGLASVLVRLACAANSRSGCSIIISDDWQDLVCALGSRLEATVHTTGRACQARSYLPGPSLPQE